MLIAYKIIAISKKAGSVIECVSRFIAHWILLDVDVEIISIIFSISILQEENLIFYNSLNIFCCNGLVLNFH